MDRYIGKERDVDWKAVLPHPPPKLNALTPEEIAERKAIGLHSKDERWAFACWYDWKGNLLTVEPTPDNPIPYLTAYSDEPDYEPYSPRKYSKSPRDKLDDIFDEMKAHLKEIADQEKLEEEKWIQEEEKRRKENMEAQQRQVEANWERWYPNSTTNAVDRGTTTSTLGNV
ncbi:unnamed protein product [Calypogeia fissa]